MNEAYLSTKRSVVSVWATATVANHVDYRLHCSFQSSMPHCPAGVS